MAGPQSVWGIDVGRCALKAIKLRLGPDRSVEVLAADYIEHSKIITQQSEEKGGLWSAALEKFLSRNDISNDKVVVSVPGQQTLASFSKLPPVEKKKIPDIVRYEADQQIPFDMDEVVWDYQIFQAADSPEVEVGIFAIKRDLIRDHLLHFEAAGIEPIAVQAAPLALYNGMQYDGDLGDETTIMVDIGTENTDLLVASDNSLWTRTINVGGNNFTEALVKSFKLSFNKAEALKRTAASSKYARQIFQAMRPVFADLVQELQRSIGFYSSTHREAELGKVIGLGSAFKLPGLKKYVQQNLQMDIDRLGRFQKIAIPDSIEGGAEQTASFGVAYGLALQGLGLSTVTSNLLPPEIAKQVIWRKKRPLFAAAAACLLLAAGVIWFREMKDAGTLSAAAGNSSVTVASVDEADGIIGGRIPDRPPREVGRLVLAAVEKLKSEHRNLSSQGNEETNKIEAIKGLMTNRAVWLRILSAIHEALPNNPYHQAETVEDYVAAVTAAEGRRQDRGEFFLESLKSEFVQNVDDEQVVIEDEFSLQVDEIKGEPNKPRPGFVLTLRGRTTHADQGLHVTDHLIANLRKTGQQPGQGFFINRIGLSDIEGDGGRSRQSQTSRRPRTRRPGRPPGRPTGRGRPPQPPPQPQAQRELLANVDPLTGESTTTDWRFQLMLEVVLQDLPEEKEKKQD